MGYLHEEQINIIQSTQDIKLSYETQLLNQEALCLTCGKKTKANEMRKSKFYTALTDHDIKIQLLHCQCGWNAEDSVDQLYGSSSHPDLIQKQVIQGCANSLKD